MKASYSTSPKMMINRGSSGGSTVTSSVAFNVTKANHGYVVSDLPVAMFNTSTGWQKALANADNTLGTHVIVEIVDTNNYILAQAGRYLISNHGLLLDNYYYVSSTHAGHLTDIEPAYYSNILLFVEDENYIHILPFRPSLSGQDDSVTYGHQVLLDGGSFTDPNEVTLVIDGGSF